MVMKVEYQVEAGAVVPVGAAEAPPRAGDPMSDYQEGHLAITMEETMMWSLEQEQEEEQEHQLEAELDGQEAPGEDEEAPVLA